jgi:hypothetical protein
MRFGPKSDPNNVAGCKRCKGKGVVGNGVKGRKPCPSCLSRQTARNGAWEKAHGRYDQRTR